MNPTYKKLFWGVSVLLAVSLACSFGSSTTPEPPVSLPGTEAPPVDVQVTQPPAVEMPGTISSLQDVQKAVIQIESQGTFVDPEFGEYTGAGSGSGFIIDPSGIAVTNNHVVTGAGLLKVWIGGDSSKAYNATVVGVSECSDLAVIDIEGDGFPYLEWYTGEISVGTDIYIAGFPLGDPEYTLTKGVVSKARANGVTAWSSIDAVLEYDATSNPGNSGGPVITTDGKVIAVHYWGNSQTRQARGISRDIATSVVEQLRSGTNVDTIGINGQAVSNQDGSVYGIWVSSVQPGSPADRAGIQGGDLLMNLGDLPMAADGTMGKYCDVLRSHSPSETLNLKLVRWATGEVLEGQLNGRELTVVSTFGGSTDTGGEDTTGTTTSSIPGVSVNANASSPGAIYYSTDFDALDDWLNYVMRGNENGFAQKSRNGKFQVEILKGKTYVYFANQTFKYTDVQLDTKVENLGQNTNYTGLFCRFNDDGWYEANILNTGEYAIYLYNGVTNRYDLLATGGSRLINMGKKTNEYTFICKGDELTLGINGYEVITVSTVKGSRMLRDEGLAGVFVASENVFPLMVEFDWFSASVVY